jgi:hypothetical protein
LWRLKIELCQHSLPKVQFATEMLPKDFSACSGKGKPCLLAKSVPATAFMWLRGLIIWRYMLAIGFMPHEKQ